MKSALVSLNGHHMDVPADSAWKAPNAGSCFGWLGADGFCTVRIEDIVAITPNAQAHRSFLLFMRNNLQVAINESDCLRLMQRLGWKEPAITKAASAGGAH